MKVENILNSYCSGKIPDAMSCYQNFRATFEPPAEECQSCKEEKTPWWTSDIAKEGAEKDYVCTDILTTMAVLNGPAMLDDMFSAYRQIKSKFKDNFQEGYDYRKAQHPFSFFRGTALNDYLNPNSEKCIDKNLAKKIIKYDKCLIESHFGEWIMKKLNIEEIKKESTKIKSLLHTHETPRYVEAKTYKSPTKFGDLTARALTRTPKIGIAVLAGTKLAHAGHQIADGENPVDELKKAAFDICATTTAVGYLGAIGAKKLGVFGSLLGISLGSALSEYATESIFEKAETF